MVSSSTKSLHNRQLAEINRLKYEARQAADTIERQAKEISKHREHIGDLQGRLWSVKGTRDQARKDHDRLDKGWCEAVQKLSEVRADRNEAQGRIVELEQERDAALAEVERLNAALASRTRTVELLKQDLGLGVGT